jgi:cell wall-associated NlpC family hydrolase
VTDREQPADDGVAARHSGQGPANASGHPENLGDAILASAIALASRMLTYSADPVKRWADDGADCSSFVQRALFGAGVTAFDPGPEHRNVWNALSFASREDVFVTVCTAEARPGDILVQGGRTTARGGGTGWKGHCGIFRGRSTVHPGLLHGVSMGRRGPALKGLWGADPPLGHFPFGANLLVRRLRPTATFCGRAW